MSFLFCNHQLVFCDLIFSTWNKCWEFAGFSNRGRLLEAGHVQVRCWKAGSLTDLTLFCSSAESQYLLFLPELISVEIASLIICQKWHAFKDSCFYSIEEEKKKKCVLKKQCSSRAFMVLVVVLSPEGGGAASRSILSEIWAWEVLRVCRRSLDRFKRSVIFQIT